MRILTATALTMFLFATGFGHSPSDLPVTGSSLKGQALDRYRLESAIRSLSDSTSNAAWDFSITQASMRAPGALTSGNGIDLNITGHIVRSGAKTQLNADLRTLSGPSSEVMIRPTSAPLRFFMAASEHKSVTATVSEPD